MTIEPRENTAENPTDEIFGQVCFNIVTLHRSKVKKNTEGEFRNHC